jgi:hypothetical protein
MGPSFSTSTLRPSHAGSFTMFTALLLTAIPFAAGSAVAEPSLAPVSIASEANLRAVQEGRPDLVVIRGRRDAEVPVAGTIVEARLDEVVIEVDGKETGYKADKVLRIQLNRVPRGFDDGKKHLKARRFAEAAAAFKDVADTSSVRTPVRAVALLQAIEAEIGLSGTDAAALGRARSLADRFVSDFSDHRDLPLARRWQARLAHLVGEFGASADGYAALFAEFDGTKAKTGYEPIDCLEAGLFGAHAALEGDDAAKARDLFAALEEKSTALSASLEATDPLAAQAQALRERAQLGEGWILLTSGKGTQARSFFKSRVEGSQLSTAQARFEARIGLARGFETGGEPRAAQLEYAIVSATAYGDRDLVARALLGQAATTLTLGDTDARTLAKQWLGAILERFPDTPSARPARELLATLGE